jgi:hypothetical protein
MNPPTRALRPTEFAGEWPALADDMHTTRKAGVAATQVAIVFNGDKTPVIGGSVEGKRCLKGPASKANGCAVL